MNQAIDLYNFIPDGLNDLNIKQFKREVKKNYMNYIPQQKHKTLMPIDGPKELK